MEKFNSTLRRNNKDIVTKTDFLEHDDQLSF